MHKNTVCSGVPICQWINVFITLLYSWLSSSSYSK